MEKEEFVRGWLGSGAGVRIGDGRLFVREGLDAVRVKRVAGRGAPVKELKGEWCNDESCLVVGLEWEVFTGLAERVQFLVWCRKFLKDGSVVLRDGFYLIG